MDTPTSNDSFYETVCVPSIAPSLWSSTTCGILGFMGGAITSTSTNHITGAHLFQASPAFLILTGLCGGMFIGAITPPLMFLIAKKCCSD